MDPHLGSRERIKKGMGIGHLCYTRDGYFMQVLFTVRAYRFGTAELEKVIGIGK